ncbi:IPT/TIG domain-containing protein [Oceanobacillus timonensis]|uniref:IPT/TIG domain-containing protein n=1 Tax=Oceanobacillus timonensis TaxID=1926285 RepID=UPI0009BB663F|nr:IPT/TIG domain-containing protein [Oceanobacillus timonensis]
MSKWKYGLIFILFLTMVGVAACSATDSQTDADAESNEETSEENSSEEASEQENTMTGKLTLDETEGEIGDEVHLTAEGLDPDEPLQVIYVDMEGKYEIENNYSFLGTAYDEVEKEVGEGTADENGEWSGSITIPDGFGDDHDILIQQDGNAIAKANFFVETVFTMSPESGPPGTEITIEGEGLSPNMYGSIWHVNYDNAYTGMITAISTDGKAEAVVRAAGSPGTHTVTVESGASGAPYLSRDSSAINYIETHFFDFTITDEAPDTDTDMAYVEEPPEPADGGIQMPEPENKEGVQISLDKEMGTVDEMVTLSGEGLPENQELTLDWHTMVGNRVSTEGFAPEIMEIDTVETDEDGSFTHEFPIPDDLGGLPHLIEVKAGDEVYGQAYLRILPSIVSIEPEEGPAGTPITVEIKGAGWTEFDNALGVTYDNAYIGYICGFNSQGTIKLPLTASGEPGYHTIDIYPSIYQGEDPIPDIYRKPQLTYRDDHPGTGIPAIRTFFKVTEE